MHLAYLCTRMFFWENKYLAYLPKAKVPGHTGVIHVITVLRSGQLQEVVGFGRTDRPKLSWPTPQAGLMLVMHLPHGNYNLATQTQAQMHFPQAWLPQFPCTSCTFKPKWTQTTGFCTLLTEVLSPYTPLLVLLICTKLPPKFQA